MSGLSLNSLRPYFFWRKFDSTEHFCCSGEEASVPRGSQERDSEGGAARQARGGVRRRAASADPVAARRRAHPPVSRVQGAAGALILQRTLFLLCLH